MSIITPPSVGTPPSGVEIVWMTGSRGVAGTMPGDGPGFADCSAEQDHPGAVVYIDGNGCGKGTPAMFNDTDDTATLT